jgi:hypothetical protein
MKPVAFLIPDRELPSVRIRVLNLVPALQRLNDSYEVLDLPRGVAARYRFFRNLGEFELVVLPKKLLSPLELLLLKRHVRRLVYDFDDAVWMRDRKSDPNRSDSDERVWRSATRAFKFAWTVRHCVGVLAGNEYLAAAARAAAGAGGPEVAVAPSAVPVSGVPQHQVYAENAVPVVGWIGSASTLPFLVRMAPTLAKVAQRSAYELRIVCNSPPQLASMRCTYVPWRLETQEQELARFDIGLMPLPDTPWTRGKCAYKLLQYMAAGIPFVASAVGMNREVADEGRAGLLAAADGEFADQLQRLLADPDLRRRLGQHGRSLAVERYSLEVVAAQVAQHLGVWRKSGEAA